MISLSNGLSDLSKELGESTTNTSARRIQHYNDAVIDFASERRWKFLVKENTSMTTVSGTQSYTIHADILADWRAPGAIKEITIGDDTDPIKPIDWEERGDPRFSGGNFFYINPEEETIYFMKEISAAETIHVHYYYIPERIEDTESEDTFPIPDRFRKVVGTLAAAYAQWGRYLEQQGNRLFNTYTRMLESKAIQQEERHQFKPKRLPHYLQYRGHRFRGSRYAPR